MTDGHQQQMLLHRPGVRPQSKIAFTYTYRTNYYRTNYLRMRFFGFVPFTRSHFLVKFMANAAVYVRREVVHLPMKLIPLVTEASHAASKLPVCGRRGAAFRIGVGKTIEGNLQD